MLLLAPEVYAPLRRAGQRYHAAEDGAHAAQALLELTSVTSTPSPRDDVTEVDPAEAPLALRGVRVAGGSGRAPALDGLSARFAPGRMTALVGPSGAGKSTLLRLLARLTEPDAGAIVCGDTDLRALDRAAWWEQIAWLPQRPALLRGPLADTLTLQHPRATPAELERSLRRAAAWEVVVELAADVAGADARPQVPPAGEAPLLASALATPVGAGGRGLSGGQQQRLALAGALVSPAPLLLLDEPTAHLDPASSATAAAGIRAAAAGRTAIVATHDPALIAVCDEIVAVRDGRVTEPALGVAA